MDIIAKPFTFHACNFCGSCVFVLSSPCPSVVVVVLVVALSALSLDLAELVVLELGHIPKLPQLEDVDVKRR